MYSINLTLFFILFLILIVTPETKLVLISKIIHSISKIFTIIAIFFLTKH